MSALGHGGLWASINDTLTLHTIHQLYKIYWDQCFLKLDIASTYKLY